LRSGGHGTGTWGVPGGFCDGEHPESTAVRETAEETGLVVQLGELVGIYTDFYESQGDRFPTLHLYYLAAAAPSAQMRLAPDEASDARWVPFGDAPGAWAFPHLAKVVADAAELFVKAPPRWSEAGGGLRGR
jgi:8-oxo-dGTP diphosphatase